MAQDALTMGCPQCGSEEEHILNADRGDERDLECYCCAQQFTQHLSPEDPSHEIPPEYAEA
jgi:uncharacterized Zn finger protein